MVRKLLGGEIIQNINAYLIKLKKYIVNILNVCSVFLSLFWTLWNDKQKIFTLFALILTTVYRWKGITIYNAIKVNFKNVLSALSELPSITYFLHDLKVPGSIVLLRVYVHVRFQRPISH